MTHKRQLSVGVAGSLAVLNVEMVATADEGLVVPPVAVHSVDVDSLGLSINGDFLVEPLLSGAEHAEGPP